MKDLEIRGAGNLLGGEQSGHIAGVGFDLYVRLVGEAVASFRGDGSEVAPVEVKIELPVDAHLPHEYVPGRGYPREVGERLRLEAYRKLASVADEAGLAEIEAELVDRYGDAARRRVRTSSRWPGCAPWPGRPGSPTSACRASSSGSRRSTSARVRRSGSSASIPGPSSRTALGTVLVPKPKTARSRRHAAA